MARAFPRVGASARARWGRARDEAPAVSSTRVSRSAQSGGACFPSKRMPCVGSAGRVESSWKAALGGKLVRVVCQASSESPSPTAAPPSSLADPFLAPSTTMAISLTFFATGAMSLFSSQCLVEAVLQAYLCGKTFDEIQLDLKLSTLTAGSPLLSETDIDMVSAWVALIFLTLEEVGVQRSTSSEAPEPVKKDNDSAPTERSRYLMGMVGYLRQTLDMYDNGYTLERLLGLQSVMEQNQEQPMMAGPSIMQHLSRLVMLTLEVVASLELPARKPLPNPVCINAPTGYTLTFMPGGVPCPVVSRGIQLDTIRKEDMSMTCAATGSKPSRGLAVRILVSFMGAALGSDYSMQRFAEAIYASYREGWSAQSIFNCLQDLDFDLAGGLLPVGGAPKPGVVLKPSDASSIAGRNATSKQLFATWLSATYMVYAQKCLPHTRLASEPPVGWAWAGYGDAEEAAGLDRFVRGVVTKLVNEIASAQALSGAEEAAEEVASVAEASEDTVTVLEPAAGQGDDTRPINQFIRIEDDKLSANSSALRLFGLQVTAVRRAHELANRIQDSVAQ